MQEEKIIYFLYILFILKVTIMIEFITSHQKEVIEALIAAGWLIVRLTPSSRDNDVFGKIVTLLSIVFPNRKKGGGVH